MRRRVVPLFLPKPTEAEKAEPKVTAAAAGRRSKLARVVELVRFPVVFRALIFVLGKGKEVLI